MNVYLSRAECTFPSTMETNKGKTLIICRQFQKKFLILLLNNQNWIKINPT